MIKKKPFVNYTLEEEKNPLDITFTVRITPKDTWFNEAKKLINQPKNSTALKQLAEIGFENVAHDRLISKIFNIIKDNLRRNERIGVAESDYKIKK
jgi:methylphosphotriester-DNA--protein-cysteine methyltransferase